MALREVGIGYDGSPESRHALGVAKRLAGELGTKLSAFQAVFFPARMYAGPAFPDHEGIEAMLDSARKQLSELGDIEAHVAYGLPAEELAVYSASLDLLVIGSRSYGPIGRLVHGSTARRLADSARCPLLVLTRAARRSSGAPAEAEDKPMTAVGS